MMMMPPPPTTTTTSTLTLVALVAWLTTTTMTTPCHGLVTAPSLAELSPKLYKTKLNYRVAIGDQGNPFQMKDMHVELSSNLRTPKNKYSTGIHETILLEEPRFINVKGEQSVELQNGGWEVQWHTRSPHGHLVCSFVNPKPQSRNDDATFETGRFFMYHRVWTRETLASERQRRRKIQSAVAQYLDDRDQKVKKMTQQDSNVLDKVVSYGQAARSMNEYRELGIQEARFIPLYDDQVLELSPDCIVSTRGLIFKIDPRPVEIGQSRVDFLQ